jgi:hypothetical protein
MQWSMQVSSSALLLSLMGGSCETMMLMMKMVLIQ